MSTGARLFLVGSIGVTGLIVYGVNYYIDQEKQRKRTNIIEEISRREEQKRLNMDQYEKQLKLEEQLRLGEKLNK